MTHSCCTVRNLLNHCLLLSHVAFAIQQLATSSAVDPQADRGTVVLVWLLVEALLSIKYAMPFLS